MQRGIWLFQKKDVEYVAKLERLSFTKEEKESLVQDLNSVLGYIDKLNELDTDNIDIIVNLYYIENKFREDVLFNMAYSFKQSTSWHKSAQQI